MKILRIFLLLLICPILTWAQTDKIADSILHGSATLIYSDLVKGEKQAMFFIQNETRNSNTAQAFLILADAAYLKGDFASVMDNIYLAEDSNPKNTETETLVRLYFARYYRLFGFEELSLKFQNSAWGLLQKIPQKKAAGLWARAYLEKAQFSAGGASKIVLLLKSETLSNKRAPIHSETAIALAQSDIALQRFGEAKHHLEPVLTGKEQNVFTARALLQMAAIDKAKGQLSLSHLHRADSLLKMHTDISTRRENSRLLADYYLKTNDVSAYKKYREQYDLLNSQLVKSLREARDRIISNLEKPKSRQSETPNYFIFIGAALLLLLGYGIYAYIKTRQDYRKFLKVIEKPDFTDSVPSRQMAIPQKTEQALLEKLSKFEKSNRFTNPNLTVITLAKSLETNTKYLSEVINRHKGTNFNQYINDLRIHYIIGKMKDDPKYRNYKIYYLAKESGFSSQSTFSTVFRAATGISPLSFIKFLKNEQQATI